RRRGERCARAPRCVGPGAGRARGAARARADDRDHRGRPALRGTLSEACPETTPKGREWIEAQRVFFVATAPAGASGRVNLSPKGTDSLRILDARTVAYLVFVCSRVETIAHLRENGRIAVMFCAFAGPPKIVRLHGRGDAVEPGDAEFAALRADFPEALGARAVIRIRVHRASDSCG